MTSESAAAWNRHTGLMIFATMCASLVAVIFLTNWPTYHFMVRGGPIPLWYYVLPGVLVIPILFAEPGSVIRFFREPLLWWFVVYVLAGLLWLLLAQDFIEDASRQWRLRVLALFFFYTITILVSDSKRPLLALVIIACVFVVAAANWFDVMRPGKFVPQGVEGHNPGRGAGTFINANAAASFVVMGALVALPFVPMRFRGLVVVAAVVGVAPTISRSGLILAAVLLLGAIFVKLLNRVQAVLALLAIALLIGALVSYYDTLIISSDSSNLDQTVNRLRWFGGEEDDASAEGRKAAAQEAQAMFLEEPLFGHGIGATNLPTMEGPHNMYFMLMAEQGLFGLFLYLSLIAIFYRQGRRLARTAVTPEGQDIGRAMIIFALFVATYGFFSHNVLDESQGIFVMAFIAAAAVQSARAASALHAAMSPPMRKIRRDFPVRSRQSDAAEPI